MGLKIVDVKLIDTCSKCRKPGDKIPKWNDGRVIEDKDISCIVCMLNKEPTPTPMRKCFVCGGDVPVKDDCFEHFAGDDSTICQGCKSKLEKDQKEKRGKGQ